MGLVSGAGAGDSYGVGPGKLGGDLVGVSLSPPIHYLLSAGAQAARPLGSTDRVGWGRALKCVHPLAAGRRGDPAAGSKQVCPEGGRSALCPRVRGGAPWSSSCLGGILFLPPESGLACLLSPMQTFLRKEHEIQIE